MYFFPWFDIYMKVRAFINIEKKICINDVRPIIIRKLICFKLKN